MLWKTADQEAKQHFALETFKIWLKYMHIKVFIVSVNMSF